MQCPIPKHNVIPAQAGIQSLTCPNQYGTIPLDPRLRGDDAAFLNFG